MNKITRRYIMTLPDGTVMTDTVEEIDGRVTFPQSFSEIAKHFYGWNAWFLQLFGYKFNPMLRIERQISEDRYETVYWWPASKIDCKA